MTKGGMQKLTETMARSLAAQIERESGRWVQVVGVFRVPNGTHWRLRLLLRGRDRVAVIESWETWYSVRAAWNELVPGVVPALCTHCWSRLPASVGLFRCLSCGKKGVCPGCLHSLQVALCATDAGFVVLWCAEHIPALEEVH